VVIREDIAVAGDDKAGPGRCALLGIRAAPDFRLNAYYLLARHIVDILRGHSRACRCDRRGQAFAISVAAAADYDLVEDREIAPVEPIFHDSVSRRAAEDGARHQQAARPEKPAKPPAALAFFPLRVSFRYALAHIRLIYADTGRVHSRCRVICLTV
jgi:hypothetical protein